MQAKKRLSETSVIQGLIDAPQRFQFVQALRILIRWMRQNGVPYEQAFARVFRFQNSLSLTFPAGEIEALFATPAEHRSDVELSRALFKETGLRLAVAPTFIGLLGAHGALPLHITERIAAAQRWEKDAGARAFIDLFSHRMVSMFFHAWGKYRLEHKLDTQGIDGLLPLLTALAGIGSDASCGSEPGTEHVSGYYAAALRTRPVSASLVSRTLTHYFGVPVELEQFVEAWDSIPDGKRSRLGGNATRLGFGAMLGGRLRRRDVCTGLNIGPLDRTEFERFLPRGAAAVALANMVARFDLPNLQFEVRLILKTTCIKRLVLRSKSVMAGRLGWDAVLPGKEGRLARSTVRYLLRPPQSHMPNCSGTPPGQR
ncbi:type VI secretion system baseplate subunit TssG [Oxalobacteraceae bacterium]|nr:type VI secretion system baseplate subunit TssG [Oxalobacteraceae bacterium]